MVLLIGAFIKFFIFGEAPSPDPVLSSRTRSISINSSAQRSLHAKRSTPHISRTLPTLTPATILAKTYYNVHSHQPESLDWFNVLIAQTIAQFRTDAHADDAILKSLNTVLNGPLKPEFLAEIKVTEISLGEEFPIFSNCRIHPVEDEENGGAGRLQARMDIDLSDFITLGVETKMVLNYPRPLTAILPIALSVSVARFSGTLAISFLPSTSSPSPASSDSPSPITSTPTTLAFSFLPTYTLSLSTRSLLGSRSRLQDVPKISQLVESRLRTWFEERCVQPRMQQVGVPSLWPRMRNVVDVDEVSDGVRIERDLKEEAKRGVEGERKEGLRWRLRAEGRRGEIPRELPETMPGVMVA